MHEEVRNKALKEKRFDYIKVDIKPYTTELEIIENVPRNDSTIISETYKCD